MTQRGYRKLTPTQALYAFDRPRIQPANDNVAGVTSKAGDEALERIRTTPAAGGTVVARPGTTPALEMDAGFYGALLRGPMVVGMGAGQMPLAVALRLHRDGLCVGEEK